MTMTYLTEDSLRKFLEGELRPEAEPRIAQAILFERQRILREIELGLVLSEPTYGELRIEGLTAHELIRVRRAAGQSRA